MNNKMQLTLDLEAGIEDRYPHLIDVVRAHVYQSSRPLKALAADLDVSQSDLSRKLSQHPDDSRRFGVDDLERLLDVTGPGLIMQWLIARYMQSQEHRKAAALHEIARLLPDIQALVKSATKQ
jgi:hypothetical protein